MQDYGGAGTSRILAITRCGLARYRKQTRKRIERRRAKYFPITSSINDHSPCTPGTLSLDNRSKERAGFGNPGPPVLCRRAMLAAQLSKLISCPESLLPGNKTGNAARSISNFIRRIATLSSLNPCARESFGQRFVRYS